MRVALHKGFVTRNILFGKEEDLIVTKFNKKKTIVTISILKKGGPPWNTPTIQFVKDNVIPEPVTWWFSAMLDYSRFKLNLTLRRKRGSKIEYVRK